MSFFTKSSNVMKRFTTFFYQFYFCNHLYKLFYVIVQHIIVSPKKFELQDVLVMISFVSNFTVAPHVFKNTLEFRLYNVMSRVLKFQYDVKLQVYKLLTQIDNTEPLYCTCVWPFFLNLNQENSPIKCTYFLQDLKTDLLYFLNSWCF